LTSADVNGLPSCHLTPWRSLKGQGLVVGAPGPALRQIPDDRIDAVLRTFLLDMAESWAWSADNKTLAFRLRQGVNG